MKSVNKNSKNNNTKDISENKKNQMELKSNKQYTNNNNIDSDNIEKKWINKYK